MPSYLKDLSANRLLLRLWVQAGAALSQAEYLTVIGYSLNEADEPARHLLGAALDRNQDLREMLVVARERFCSRFTKRYRPICAKFEDWVRKP